MRPVLPGGFPARWLWLALLLAGFAPEPEDASGWTLVRSKENGAREDAIVTQSATAYRGKSAIRVDIRQGDCVPEDCAADRERVELKSLETEIEGDERWYRWAFRLPDDTADIWPARMFIAQFHQENGPPALLFSVEPEGLVLESRFAGGPKPVLVPKSALLGKWHQIDLHAVWSRSDGLIEVHVDGNPIAGERRRTMSETEIYFKAGLYRAHLSRNPDAARREQSIFLDSLQRFTRAPPD